MEIERGSAAKLTAWVRWGFVKVLRGGNTTKPLKRCPRCRGRLAHRRAKCKGTLEVVCRGVHKCDHTAGSYPLGTLPT